MIEQFRPGSVSDPISPWLIEIPAGVLDKKYKLTPKFKRPNDVLIKGKKICGVLVEASTKAGKLESAVIGIGLNVNSEPKELLATATSLKVLKRKKFSQVKILKEILTQLKQDLKSLYDHSS